jgi:hypothetical protein
MSENCRKPSGLPTVFLAVAYSHRLGWNRVDYAKLIDIYSNICDKYDESRAPPADHLESLLFLADYSVNCDCFDSAED